MNKLLIIFIISLIVVLAAGCDSYDGPPNVLFICIDDLRPELGCYGNPVVQSPNLDNLASEGCLFVNHYVQVPTCGASRFTLLTGMRPSKRGHLSNDVIKNELSDKPEGPLPETFIHHLRRNGYYTVGIGKISHYVDGLVYEYEEPLSDKLELPYSWDEMLLNNGKWGTGWNAFFGYANGENRQSMNRQVKPYEAGAVDDDGYVDGLTTELALTKIKELKEKKQPFFLAVGFFKPHLPFTAPKKYWDLYSRDDIPLSPNPFIPVNVNLKSLHESGEMNGYQLTDEVADLSHSVSDNYAKKLRHAYYASISYIDAQVGKILKELRASGLDKNTIVVVWGDHGWHLGDQRVWGKHTIFESSLRSAFIMRLPGKKSAGHSIASIVETVDIYPTLLELCNVELPYQTDGESFMDLLDRPDLEKNDVAYGYFRNGISLRTDRYRLTRYFRPEEPVIELYDYKNDPYETQNIAAENSEIVSRLMPLLEEGNTGLYDTNTVN